MLQQHLRGLRLFAFHRLELLSREMVEVMSAQSAGDVVSKSRNERLLNGCFWREAVVGQVTFISNRGLQPWSFAAEI